MFDGALSPWHVAIVVVVVFLVFGPKRIVTKVQQLGDAAKRFADDKGPPVTSSEPQVPHAKSERRSLAYRLGRRISRRARQQRPRR
jgi:TatA/E family protein of Tat protein translocase